jgi:pimeloyl-ACP methyl ester carboxylesterase
MILKANDTTAFMRKTFLLLIAFFCLVCISRAQLAITITERTPSRLATVQVNGVVLHYLDRGHGIPVVFVHGGLDDFRMWQGQIEPFAKYYRVIAYSRRYNYPNENSQIRADHSAIVEAEDLAALIRKLRLKRVHIIGHSYGALTALLLAVRHPELVRTLVLAEPPILRWAQETPKGLELFNDFIDNMWKPTGNAFRRGEKEQALRLTKKYFAGDSAYELATAEERQYWMDNLLEWQALTTSSNAFPELRRVDVTKIGAPVLMLSGALTLPILKIVDSELQPLLRRGERVIIPNATHEMWGEQPDACKKATLAFLARH